MLDFPLLSAVVGNAKSWGIEQFSASNSFEWKEPTAWKLPRNAGNMGRIKVQSISWLGWRFEMGIVIMCFTGTRARVRILSRARCGCACAVIGHARVEAGQRAQLSLVATLSLKSEFVRGGKGVSGRSVMPGNHGLPQHRPPDA